LVRVWSTVSYKNLEVWQKARELVAEVYLLSESLPPAEQFGLTSQMRRAAVSIPSNIAEGYGRDSAKAYGQFLRIAKGSVNELETLLILAADLRLMKEQADLLSRIAKVGSMLTNLIRKVEQDVVRENLATYDATTPA
jgi:four helix bundle protein